jgi:hypothetical protein
MDVNPRISDDGGKVGAEAPAPQPSPDGPKVARRIPLLAKVISSAVALAPIALIGAPLHAAGLLPLAGLVVAASLGYAAFPFMTANTAPWIRAIPGVAVGLLGLAAIALGAANGGGGLAAIGALAALGGWGLVRFATIPAKWESQDETDILLTMLGMLSAITSVGLAAVPAVGVAGVIKVAAIIFTVPLLMQLPGWWGDSIVNLLRGLYRTAREAYAVATSIRRDTNGRKRVLAYADAALTASSWNGIWLGLIVLLPILLCEAVQFIGGIAVGLLSGALQAPQLALWTTVHHFAKDSSLNKRLAFGAHAVARRTSKQDSFNRWARPFIPWANSESPAQRALAGLGIRIVQLLWLLTTPFISLVGGLLGWVFAGDKARQPYDSALHDPKSLAAAQDLAGKHIPGFRAPEFTLGVLPARILASGIGGAGLLALVLLPGFGGGLVALTGFAIALMPLMPAKNVPAWLAHFTGRLLMASGLFAITEAAYRTITGSAAGRELAAGVIAFLAGLGLNNLILKVRREETGVLNTDDWRYSLGYVGALGTVGALTAAMRGPDGLIASILFWSGVASSLTLLAHLPKYLWLALVDTLAGVWSSLASSFRAFGAWHRKTTFVKGYLGKLGLIIEKYSIFVAPILLPFFLPIVAAYLLEWAAALTVGLALGILHSPSLFVGRAAHHQNPKGRMSRFWSGLNDALYGQLEGTRETFLEPFVESYNPPGKDGLNWFGLFMAGLGTSLWLLRTALALLLAPALLAWGVIQGIHRARTPVSETDPEKRPG